MKTFTHWLALGLANLLLVGNISAAAANLDDPAVVEAFVDGVVKPLMANNNSPAGTVAIVKDGELIFAKGYGFQNKAKNIPVDPARTLFRPGSTSKLFTWVGVMQLVEQGKLDLDADVNTYLKNFKIKDTFETPVTLRDIMTHSAGFEDGALGYLIIEDEDRVIPLAEAMERYQPERVNPPGAQTAYSNYATAIAGLIVANVSGLSFNDYIRQNILEPLGMNHSSFDEPLPAHLINDMAVSYSLENGSYVEKPFEIIANFGPAGSMSAASTDMVRFAQAILNGGELDGQRILKESTVDEMLSRNFSHDDRLMGMALGFYETEHNGIRIVGHGGDTMWFHSDLSIDLQDNVAFFVSFAGSGGSAIRSSFVPAFYDQFFPKKEEPPVPPEDFADRAGKYAGDYSFWRGNFSTIEKAAGVASSVKVAPTEDNTLMVAFAGKTKQYAEVEKNLFRQMDSNVGMLPGLSPRLIAFQENDNGEITGFVMDGLPFMSLRKLSAYETPGFNMILAGLSLFILLMVLLRRFFQRKQINAMPNADKSAIKAGVIAAAANWLALIIGVVVLSMVGEELMNHIPVLLKVWLILPVIAFAAGVYVLYMTTVVWRQGLLAGPWARIRYSFVMLAALFMCWFYYFWNILGWQYLG
jgi:CubicO group peptidase (beta-lactamase class C family)